MSEIKYGNLPVSVVEEIRVAMGGNPYAFKEFLAEGMPVLAVRWPADKGYEKLQSTKDKEIHELRSRESQSAEIFKTLRQVLNAKEEESLVDVARARMSELAQKPREGVPQESLRVSRSDTSRCRPTLEEVIGEYGSWIGNAKFSSVPSIFWKESVSFFQARGYELIGIDEVLGKLLLTFRTKR